MRGTQRLLRILDRWLDRDLSLAVLPGLTGLVLGLLCDKAFDRVTETHSTWTLREILLAVLTVILLVLAWALHRQWARRQAANLHRHAVKTNGGILLAVDELGKEETTKTTVLKAAANDYLDVIEVPGPRRLDAGWHWTADERCGPHWDTALDQLVFGVRTYQSGTVHDLMPAIVTWASWPVALGLGQRLGGGYEGRNRPQRIVPRPSNRRGSVLAVESRLGTPQTIIPTPGYSLTERLGHSEFRWPVDLGADQRTGDVPTLLLVRATGREWDQLPCQGELATAQRRPLTLRDATGLDLNLSGEHVVHERRWHMPDAPDGPVDVEPQDIVNLAQNIARWTDDQVRRAPGDVLLVPADVAFVIGVFWSQRLRSNPLTGRRVLPIVFDIDRKDLAVVGLDLSRTEPRPVTASPRIGEAGPGSGTTPRSAQP
ncbi:MAG: hypothetical protein QG597_2384 [Actinomycetota bacterium]|nr:hypothetical protein [Actinomycetota bacterium]